MLAKHLAFYTQAFPRLLHCKAIGILLGSFCGRPAGLVCVAEITVVLGNGNNILEGVTCITSVYTSGFPRIKLLSQKL
jgi:hypothetical protein